MDLRRDVRDGLRGMWRSPALTTVVVLSLALGIGATTAIFSVIHAVMLRQLPARDPSRLVELLSRYPGEPRMNFFGHEVYDHFRDRSQSFEALAGVSLTRDGEPVTPNYFSTLGLQPALGRLIGPGDTGVVVISWTQWRTQFGGDPGVIGRSISVDGAPATIIGVAPRGFSGLTVGRPAAMWMPMTPSAPVQLFGRLKPDVTVDQARAELRVLDRFRIEPMAERDPQWRHATLEVESAATGFSWLRDQFGTQLRLLMIVVVLLLVIACTNVATLLAARATTRQREIAVRAALGASRVRLLRQLSVESLLFALPGGLLGLALARAGAVALVDAWPIDSRARIDRFDIGLHLDAPVVLFAVGLTLATALIVGLAPAWSALSASAIETLRQARNVSPSRWARRAGHGLVVAQVAVSIVMLSAALLLAGHVWALRTKDLGFDRTSVFIVGVDQPRGPSRAQLFQQYREMAERFDALPGVTSAALAAQTPMQAGGASRFVAVEGHPDDPASRRRVSLNWVGPRYFATLRTPLLAGREFAQTDDGDARVAIVNRRLAQQYFGDDSPLGHRFTLEGGPQRYEIVGVAADAKYSSLQEPAPATIYLNALTDARGNVSQFALRLDDTASPVIDSVRRIVREVAPAASVNKTRLLADQLDASIVSERLVANLATTLGACGALLAAIGLYGLLAHAVASRRMEIGIRMALGATRAHVRRMVIRTAMMLVAVGVLLAVPLSFWTQQIAAGLIANLDVTIVGPAAGAVVAMAVIAFAAAVLPARRASRVDPVEALRTD